ncbi:winged helix DNA-binding domain-containing protein [Allorhizocola rhizosphaerae]|uniref:winged helix DNA-binding domain-containing protein n=1 Tax=Allorhizocola rhizosphaerae TaxID=1872709 RepID=UPI000E3C7F0C|nr:winged helix DNA-binding domain-containing protein [Allorhizocola rhizosphaerae]
MTALDITRLRLRSQRLSPPEGKTPADVVRWFGAIQSQDLPASLWAVGQRMAKTVTEADVERAIADKTLIRSWPMRGTIHLMPAEDARWMVRLLAPRIDAKAARNYRVAGLSPETIKRAGDVMAETLAGRQCTRAEVYEALNAEGIPTDGHNGQQRGMHLLVHWARHGLICVTPRRGKQQTFALMDEWMPGGVDLSGEEALAEMARRYFRSHGPATIKDFAGWTGVTLTEARRAAEAVKGEFDRETGDDGAEYWLSPGLGGRGRKAPPVFLLPPFDEYTVAYADRSAVIGSHALAAVGHGIASNLIIDGRLAGLWKRTLKRDSISVEVQAIRPLSREEREMIPAAVERYARFLGLSPTLALK